MNGRDALPRFYLEDNLPVAALQKVEALVPRDLKDRDPDLGAPALCTQVLEELVQAKALDGAHGVSLAAARGER